MARETSRSWRCVASSSDGTKLVAAVGWNGQIYTSADSGVTWIARESNRYWRSIASSADGTKLVAVVDAGQIYTSTDSGATWTARENNRNWYSVASSADGTKLVAVVQQRQIYTSTDSGATWTARENNRGWWSVASSADGTKLVAGVSGGQIYTSTDSGVTWTARDSSRFWQSIASSADGTKLVATVDGGQIYTSADSGVTWTPRESNRSWFSVASSADGSKLVAMVNNGQIYTSTAGIGTGTGLVFTPGADTSGSPYASFTFQVQDDGGTANDGVNLDPSPKTMTINVTPVNDPPTLTGVSALAGATEDTPFTISYAALAGAANEADVDGDVISFRVEAVSSGTLTKNGTAVTPGSTLLGTGESLVWTPVANANGTLNAFTVKAWDGNLASSTPVQVQVNVTAVNDTPTISKIADRSINEDSSSGDIGGDIFFAVGDIETPAANLTVGASSSNPALAPVGNIVFGGTGGNRTVTVTPAANQNGVTTITVTVNDGVANASDSFVLTVNPVNDAPTGSNNSVATPEDTAYTFAAADFGFSDVNDSPANSFLAMKVTTLPSAGALTMNGTGVNAGDFVSLEPIPASATWTARENNRNWSSVASSSDGTKLVAAAYGGRIYTSTDSGVSWTARESNRNWYSVASSADGSKLVAVVHLGGQIYTSTDSGVNWTARESVRSWRAVASSADGTKLVAAVAGGQLYTSTDSGVSWTARESNRSWTSVASSADGAKLVATHNIGQIYTSTDSGVTWTARESNRNWSSVASSSDGTKLVAGVTGGAHIYTSTDSGVTWTPRESNQNWSSVASSSDGTKLVAVVEFGQIYTSTAAAGLVFTPAGNANGSPYTTFTFQVQDDGGTASGGVNLDPSPKTMTINVTPVNDAPVAAAGPDQVVTAGADCKATVTLDGTGSTDIDGDTLTYQWTGSFGTANGPVSSVILTLGIHTITLTVSDGQGGVSTDMLVVTVNDTTPPVITSCAPAQSGSANTSCQAAVPDFTSGVVATDCNGPPLVTQSPAAGTLVGLGVTAVTISVKDAANNESSCTANFTVKDTTPPVPDVATLPVATGECSVTLSAPTATDNCAGKITGTTTDPVSYTAQGNYTVTWTYNDGHGNTTTQTQAVSVKDTTPPVPDVASLPVATGECSVTLTPPTATDNCAGKITGTTADPLSYTAQGNYTVTWTYNDGHGNTTTQTQAVTVKDLTPPDVMGAISAPMDSLIVQSQVNLSAEFTDNCEPDSAIWDWGDGNSSSGSVTQANGSGSVTGSHVYGSPGVYTVTLTITDEAGNSVQSSFSYVVIYDPDGGFVTGGGWISSPAGAYVANPSLTGKATFGFISKYQKGAKVPSGNTEFQFRVANFNFHSEVYQWLVVSGATAQYKGTGTINGAGNYGFLLTATDGQITGGGGVDLFRIKIWDLNNNGEIVYDNGAGASDDLGKGQAIAGGSIVVHK